MSRSRRLVVAALAAVAFCAAPAAGRARGTYQSFEHERFSMRLPAGWHVADQKPGPKGRLFVAARHPRESAAARVVHLADGKGNFFSVHVDQAFDIPTDAVWTVRPGADGATVEIGREGAPCGGGATRGSSCSAGNGTLEIGTLPAVTLHGHTYGFEFGNVNRETGVDLDTFRWLLQNFRAR
jgi:hypothetical protein